VVPDSPQKLCHLLYGDRSGSKHLWYSRYNEKRGFVL